MAEHRRRSRPHRARRTAPVAVAVLAVLAAGGAVTGLVVADRAGEDKSSVAGPVPAPLGGPPGVSAGPRRESSVTRPPLPAGSGTPGVVVTGQPTRAPASSSPGASSAPEATSSAAPSTPPGATPAKPAPMSASGTAVRNAPPEAPGDRVLTLVNEQRAGAGCKALTADPALTRLAQAHSDDMAERDYFDHKTPDGSTPWDRAGKAGVGNLGAENIARGQKTPEAVMEAWMNSPGHRANILDCKLSTLGMGVRQGSGGPWWTQEFGR